MFQYILKCIKRLKDYGVSEIEAGFMKSQTQDFFSAQKTKSWPGTSLFTEAILGKEFLLSKFCSIIIVSVELGYCENGENTKREARGNYPKMES